MKTPFNKFLYIGFLLLGLYQAILSKDYMQAAASLGIGLAFDPFDTEQKWNDMSAPPLFVYSKVDEIVNFK